MDDLVNEKYRVVSLVSAARQFTITSLLEKLAVAVANDAIYAAIGEMLEKGFLQITEEAVPVFNDKMQICGREPVRVYQVVQQKQQEIEDYKLQLYRQSVQPDAEGKPGGLNYRVLEQLVKEATQTPEMLQDEETVSLIEQYFASTQSDELSELLLDQRQRALSEAYLRMLYGAYISVKKQWTEAVIQFLRASQLFASHGLANQQRIAEARIYEILISQYQQLNECSPPQPEYQHWEFLRKLDDIKRMIGQMGASGNIVNHLLNCIAQAMEKRLLGSSAAETAVAVLLDPAPLVNKVSPAAHTPVFSTMSPILQDNIETRGGTGPLFPVEENKQMTVNELFRQYR